LSCGQVRADRLGRRGASALLRLAHFERPVLHRSAIEAIFETIHMKRIKLLGGLLAVLASTVVINVAAGAQEVRRGKVVTEHLTSEVLRENRIGLNLNRSLSVYLPPDYEEGTKSYPVIYYLHSINWSNERMFAEANTPQPVLDRAIAEGVIREFILVAADYSGPTMGSWYENSPTSGRWLDYTTQEVIPYVDQHFRTLRNRDSRAVAGEFLGGYGALKLAMLHPDLFGSVYALHPVGTGSGLMPGQSVVDWPRFHRAKAFADLWGDHYAPGFMAMSQAYLPNADRPPFYCDFIVEMVNGEPKLNVENVKKLQSRFHLDQLLREHGDNLRKLRGIAFDWGRYDSTQSHVYSNQAFTRLLDQIGIEHTAEEYNGGAWDKNWIPHGRVENDLLPFLNRHLVFE
jgi:S-formylglutathione hydrolase FrmB